MAPFKIKDRLKRISSAAFRQFLEVLLGGVKTGEPMLLLPLRREQESGGRAGNLKLPHQVHVIAAFQAHRDEELVQGLNHCGVLVGLTDQPATVRSPFHKKFQGKRAVGFFRLVQRLLPVHTPFYQL